MKTVILFGASSAIAQSYVSHLNQQATQFNIICVSSSNIEYNDDKVTYFYSDYSAQSLNELAQSLKSQQIELAQVIIFNGQLHNDQHMPEKKLEEINSDYFMQLLHSNTLVPLRLLIQ